MEPSTSSILRTAILLLLLPFTGAAQMPLAARPLLPLARIQEVLRDAGVTAKVDELSLPVQITATVASPALQIQHADWNGKDKVRLSIRCKVSGECVPFAVDWTCHDSSLAAALIAQSREGKRGTEPRPPVVLAGQQTVFILEDPHMQISLPVLLIDSGAVGAEVRVATLDRKQTFRGSVSEDGVVKGVLP